MVEARNLLGEYLRARRELVTPERAGIPTSARRKVAGLRREEVAMLAGISAEYYVRLEQGRDRRPSRQVLEAIARVLQLDVAHLVVLADAVDPARPGSGRARVRRETPPPSLLRLVQTLPVPAFVEGRYLDVLAANPLATAVSACLDVGRNRLRDVFLDPSERALFTHAERAAGALIAGFRRSVGTDVDDPRVIALVGELSVASPLFRRLWARHDVADRGSGAVVLDHPMVGALRLDRDKLAVTGADGMMLVVYQPSPGTDAGEKLAFLGSVAATTIARHGPSARAGGADADSFARRPL
ncbi:helix-turn-helix transcriptional regulator [Cellulomonas sp. IC4_254]|uniref:helix-turn-helix domain-containing protein n=1 Tax=Cellulomonas sp. IC4_254 TaxID=2714040 RepID=UPI0014244614|nr:helix-turn-helix transcriptional regulator [Cellulomonas sp. IC4_254]NHT16087.1 helix-turn-helix transcriptional regulator [Cellulomonas sp. IC4_254]